MNLPTSAPVYFAFGCMEWVGCDHSRALAKRALCDRVFTGRMVVLATANDSFSAYFLHDQDARSDPGLARNAVAVGFSPREKSSRAQDRCTDRQQRKAFKNLLPCKTGLI